jgi:GDP-mannose 6-dehydrogenase
MKEEKMRISIIGLGYVGTVCSACFAQEGHHVIGVDLDNIKIDLINNGKSPIVEKDLDTYIAKAVEEGKLEATTDLNYAIENSDITIICVGTPSKINGSLDLAYIETAAKSIGEVLKTKSDYHIVSMRSTVLPGTAKTMVIPIIEEISKKKLGKDFGYVSNPEFLRESTAIADFYDPALTIIGTQEKKSLTIFNELYSFLHAPLYDTNIEVAEMMKYAANSWHATKITFSNEIGMICKNLGIDSHKVMDIFCKDSKLNISTYYMKPGFAFGGSCLPKDVRAIVHKAKSLDVTAPLLNSLMTSNIHQIKRIVTEFVIPLKKRRVAILGLSFKANTDDLRESPILELAEMLIGKGYELSIYDQNVMKAKEDRANKVLLEGELHHINERLETDINKVAQNADILIIGNTAKEFANIEERYPDKYIIDLMRITNKESSDNYAGICW